MPRVARLDLPGYPFHVVQRGVNRERVFEDDADRCHYLALLRRAASRYAVSVHAYVLMTNHVHLLVTADRDRGLSAAMSHVGQCYAQAFNRRHGRVGTLFQGRFKSCLVDSDAYLLAVYRYIELNPVRAGMVGRAEEYRWSSVHANAFLRRDPLVTPHRTLLATAGTPVERARRHLATLREDQPAHQIDAIRQHLARERTLGTEVVKTS